MQKNAEEILKQLTLDEKIGMVHGAELFRTAGVERLGIPPLVMSDGPMGVRQEFEPDCWKPMGGNDDFVTYLPCNSALASTWNPGLAHEMGSVLGEEARGRGKDVILAPGVNIKRTPLCGRNFEYFSEDPYLTKKMAASCIQGIQQWDVAACVKHFAVNNQEVQRMSVDVEIEEQVLRKIYLPAFQEAIEKGGSYSIMGAYNQLYGEHCCQSDFLLRKILREEWGYDGVVISDWGGVHDTKAGAESQLDIEMSVTDHFDQYFLAEPLKEKIQSGEISEKVLDEKVLRILNLMIRLHMLDGQRKKGSYNTAEHRQKALEAARESMVLLKNEDNILPLKKETLKRVLVIGENADCVHSNGGGSAEIKALYEITPLMGLKTHLGGNTEITYVKGYCREEKQEKGSVNWQETSLEEGGAAGTEEKESMALAQKREALRKEAVSLAETYETVIYVGGLNHELDCENQDRPDMKLPYRQDLLIQELLAVRPDMTIVMMGGSPVEMGSWIAQAKSLVWCWYAGMEGGNALAEVLLGEINPSGKLPETFYKTHTDCSAHALGEYPGGRSVAYKEGRYVGYRYNDKFQVEPEFCFGYGLSYTTFSCCDPAWNREKNQICCKIKNTGNRYGGEVLQLYRRDGEDELFQELAGFEKVFLEAGEEKQVVFQLEEESSESCKYGIGSSSRDIYLEVE
ncbi:MAG: glycosyl hydrolase [Lachnospiraceae bacterium]|nr:glycosyl hydrolase [Lachnospiraceae bacterium]